MGYVAVKGGQDAIANAAELLDYYRRRERTAPVELQQVRAQFRMLIDRVMSEGALYAPDHAALALKQVEGDQFEAAFLLRAYRTTLARRYDSEILNTREMFVQRRISSAFRDIPGGQILGATRDYTQRLLNPSLLQEALGNIDEFLKRFDAGPIQPVRTFSKVIDLLSEQGLLKQHPSSEDRDTIVDVSREAIRFPAPRSAVLQTLARAETGGLMALAYSAMRGFGGDHGTVGELRVGDVPVRVKDGRGRVRRIGRIRVSEAEMLGNVKGGKEAGSPHLTMGYGLCFGQNETKAICMGILDTSMRDPDNRSPSTSQEFVLYHTECIEAYGFTNHLKLPHYVTFQSSLDNLRRAEHKTEMVNQE